MRPFWLLAPKLPRKYPVTERSPNFGVGRRRDGHGRRRHGRENGGRLLLGVCSVFRVVSGIGVGASTLGSSAKASVDRKAVSQQCG